MVRYEYKGCIKTSALGGVGKETLMQIVMHSYTFRSYPLKTAFCNAQRFGWDGIELQPCHFNPEKVEQELPEAVVLGARYGVPILCLDFGGDFSNPDQAVVEKGMALAEAQIKACAANGVKLMNGCAGLLSGPNPGDFAANGSAMATDAHYERSAEALRHLGRLAAPHGIKLTTEIHMNTIHDSIASTLRLLDMVGLDNVLANPDPGNMFATIRAERDPESLELLRDRIGYFHFKNCITIAGQFDFSAKLADGHINYHKWVTKLANLGYDGPVCVEFCGEGDPHASAEQDVQYLRRTLEYVTCDNWPSP